MKSVFAGNKAKFAYFSFIFIIISTAMYTFYAKEPHWWYIVWNDILAVIPLFAAMLCEHYFSKKKAVPAVIFGFLWLLFFPNSPYMMTDLKYTSYFKESAYLEYEKIGTNVTAWLIVLNLTVTVILGLLFGMMSMRIIHKIINKRFGKATGVAFCTITILLSSFAIYIGRYARVNSWDIVRPIFLIEKSLNSLSEFSPIFIALFCIATAMLYVLYYAFDKFVIKHN